MVAFLSRRYSDEQAAAPNLAFISKIYDLLRSLIDNELKAGPTN